MRKDHSENAERKWRFNIFDFILLALLIAALVALGALFVNMLPEKDTTSGDTQISYVITVTDVAESIAAQIQTGQTVYDTATGRALGTVSAVATSPYIVKGVNEATGELVANTIAGRCNVNVTVSASTKSTPQGYNINGTVIACGQTYTFRTATVALSGACVSLKNQ